MVNIFHFASPERLWLLLIAPAILLLHWLVGTYSKRKLRRMGNPATLGELMPAKSVARGWIKSSLIALAVVFIALAAARPQTGAKLSSKERKGREIVLVVDVSNSMLAEDYSPNRLDRAKLAISRLVDKLRDDRIGLIVFAGNSFVQLPITTDYVSAKMFLNSISTDSVPIQGTAIGEAINTAIRSFSAQSEKSRAIIIITDGENHEDDPVAAAKQAAELGIRVFAIGVGSPEGKPIPMDGELLKDKEGNIVVTRLEEPILRDVASVGNGAYVRAGNSEFGLNPIIDDIRKMEDEKYSSIVFEEFDEQFMYFLAIALFFFVVEMLIGDRRSKRHLFKR